MANTAINARPITQLDQDIIAWQKASAELDKVKDLEMTLRNKVMAAAFPSATKGTNTLPLGNGFQLKGVKDYNYNLANTKDGRETENVLDEIEKMGNEGAFIADRLVTWSPRLSLTEYNNLSAENPTHVKIRALIDSVLTITDAAPKLEVKPPKGR